MHLSRVNARGQTTLPAPIREWLDLGSGDHVRYMIEGDRIVLTKFCPIEPDFLKLAEAVFLEWRSHADADAFNGL